jgi:hypothetical protein
VAIGSPAGTRSAAKHAEIQSGADFSALQERRKTGSASARLSLFQSGNAVQSCNSYVRDAGSGAGMGTGAGTCTGTGVGVTGSSGGGGEACGAAGSAGACTGGGVSGLVTLAQPAATAMQSASAGQPGIRTRKSDMNFFRYEIGSAINLALPGMGGAPR